MAPTAGPLASKLEPGANGQLQEVRFFSSEPGLQKSIDSALSTVTENSAVLQLEKNPTGLNVAIAAKLNGHWSIAGAWQRSDWGDSLMTKAKFSW